MKYTMPTINYNSIAKLFIRTSNKKEFINEIQNEVKKKEAKIIWKSMKAYKKALEQKMDKPLYRKNTGELNV